MALDIMQSLVGLLCQGNTAQSACNTFINSPSHQVAQPLGPLIYFLFFPSVFLLLLIYIGTGLVLRGNVTTVKGLRLLLAIAVFVAIVIQGMYPLMLWLSDIWFLFLPFLFIFYFIVRHRGGPSGGGGGPSHGVGTAVGGLTRSSVINALLGNRELNIGKILSNPKLLDDEIKTIKSKIKVQEDLLKDCHEGYEKKPVIERISKLKDQLREFEEIKKRGLKYNSAKNPSYN